MLLHTVAVRNKIVFELIALLLYYIERREFCSLKQKYRHIKYTPTFQFPEGYNCGQTSSRSAPRREDYGSGGAVLSFSEYNSDELARNKGDYNRV